MMHKKEDPFAEKVTKTVKENKLEQSAKDFILGGNLEEIDTSEYDLEPDYVFVVQKYGVPFLA